MIAQCLAVMALLFTVAGLVLYSFWAAARQSSQADDLTIAEPHSDAEGCATSAANMAMVIAAVCVFAAAQIWLPGPPEAQAQQDIADAVLALDEAQAEADAVALNRTHHESAMQPPRRQHGSVVAAR